MPGPSLAGAWGAAAPFGAVTGTLVAVGGTVMGAVGGGLVVAAGVPARPAGRGAADGACGPAKRSVRRSTALRPAARMPATTQSVIPILRIVDHLAGHIRSWAAGAVPAGPAR